MYAKFIETDLRFAFSEKDNGGFEINKEEHRALFAGQSSGKRIVPGPDGRPALAEPPEPTEEEKIKAAIAALEAQVTARRVREAVLGEDGGWLAGVNGQIAELRKQLS